MGSLSKVKALLLGAPITNSYPNCITVEHTHYVLQIL